MKSVLYEVAGNVGRTLRTNIRWSLVITTILRTPSDLCGGTWSGG